MAEAGATSRHGPHQAAHRSTNTGTVDRPMMSSRSAPLASVNHGRSVWQDGHRGLPAVTIGTRLTVPQEGQRRRCRYSLTPEGRKALARQRREWTAFSTMVNQMAGVGNA